MSKSRASGGRVERGDRWRIAIETDNPAAAGGQSQAKRSNAAKQIGDRCLGADRANDEVRQRRLAFPAGLAKAAGWQHDGQLSRAPSGTHPRPRVGSA